MAHWYQAIVEQAAEAIVFADRGGIIRIWNRGAERLFGYSAAEALANNLDMIIPERFRVPHWAGFSQAIDAGETRNAGRVLRTRSVHKNGGKLYVELSFGVTWGPDGAVAGAFAIGRESTAA